MIYDDKTKMNPLAPQLQQLFGKKSWHTLWQTYILVRKWPEIAGSKIAKRCEPAYVQNHILFVHVRDSVWMQHLQTMKPELVEKVHRVMPDLRIDDIRWVMQPAGQYAEIAKKKEPKINEVDPAEQKAFTRISSIVENEECRTALCKLWQTYHKHQ